MKKLTKCLVIMMMLAMVVLVVSQTDTYAATKKKAKVTYTLKKGTLTIKGKGKMPKSMTFEHDDRIKEVVIKKGVTSISRYAFLDCKNLKK